MDQQGNVNSNSHFTTTATQTPFSLVIIARDEEAKIERCIRSVPMASDVVVVVDNRTQDKTAERARACGARVLIEPWRGFAEQKRFATRLAAFDWVLCLDADEALSDASQKELLHLLTSGQLVLSPHHSSSQYLSYEFPRLSFHLNRWIRYGGWYPDWQLRFFNRKYADWSHDSLHERVQNHDNKDKPLRMQYPILHWPFDTLGDQVQTNNHYSSLGANELQRQNRSFSRGALFIKPITKFIETYFIKRGFLDGTAGLIIAVGAAYSVFLKWAKLYELQHFNYISKANNTSQDSNQESNKID